MAVQGGNARNFGHIEFYMLADQERTNDFKVTCIYGI